MTPDDFRAWVPAVATIAGWVGIIATMIYRKGGERKQIDEDRKANHQQHTTLTEAVREADRKARAAHSRVDEMETRVTRLEADNENTARTLARSMGSLERALDATNKRIDALLSQLAHNGGHS